ncbi:MAG TPA: hypothetical protein VGQ04_16910 [Chitinophagaceae bacterium]|nr:hypothetical protein [Chitinophagaceae bacterium]
MRKFSLFILTSIFIFSANAQSDPSPRPPLSDFVGRYVFPDGSVVPDVTVALSGDALTMTSAAGSSVLTDAGRDTFTIVEFSGLAVFKRGDDKKVNGVHIEAQGYVLDGQKQSGGAWSFTYYLNPNRELLVKR